MAYATTTNYGLKKGSGSSGQTIEQQRVYDNENADTIDATMKTISDAADAAQADADTAQASADTAQGEVDALENLVSTIFDPIATYTHTSNKVVNVTAVDLATGTFTAVAHGLTTGLVICPFTNNIEEYPLLYFPTGLTQGYHTVNVLTADTFNLKTSGGVVETFTTNATMDLTKFHFEQFPTGVILIENLPILKRALVRVNGRSSSNGLSYVLPSFVTATTSTWINSKYTTINYPDCASGGSVHVFLETLIDTQHGTQLRNKGIATNANTKTANLNVVIDNSQYTDQFADTTFTGIRFQVCFMANGTVVEVYKA